MCESEIVLQRDLIVVMRLDRPVDCDVVKRLLFWCKSSLGLDATEAPPLYTTTVITGTISRQHLMTSLITQYRTAKHNQKASSVLLT